MSYFLRLSAVYDQLQNTQLIKSRNPTTENLMEFSAVINKAAPVTAEDICVVKTIRHIMRAIKEPFRGDLESVNLIAGNSFMERAMDLGDLASVHLDMKSKSFIVQPQPQLQQKPQQQKEPVRGRRGGRGRHRGTDRKSTSCYSNVILDSVIIPPHELKKMLCSDEPADPVPDNNEQEANPQQADQLFHDALSEFF